MLAYHDRSDGGLFATLARWRLPVMSGSASISMCWQSTHSRRTRATSRSGRSRSQCARNELILKALFTEELGAVLQIRDRDKSAVMGTLRAAGLGSVSQIIGKPNSGRVEFWCDARPVLSERRAASLQRSGAKRHGASHGCATTLIAPIRNTRARAVTDDLGLSMSLSFDPSEDIAAPFIARGHRPRVAILREQGVNSQTEMAYAFHRAGFASVDVT